MSGKDELLDKAIVEAKEAEDWQLVEWLRTARGSESAARWYSDKLREAHRAERKLLNENAKLRELVKAMTPFLCCMPFASCNTLAASVRKRMSELGVEVGE